MFGFTHPKIKHYIEHLEGADQCVNYRNVCVNGESVMNRIIFLKKMEFMMMMIMIISQILLNHFTSFQTMKEITNTSKESEGR